MSFWAPDGVASFRFGGVAHPLGGVRFGTVTYANLVDRYVAIEGSYRPGEAVTVSTYGLWDASGKTVTVGGVAVTPILQTAETLVFHAPSYHTAAGFDLFNYNVSQPVVVTDSTGSEETTLLVLPPVQPGHWYIGSITGSPWTAASVLYQSTGLVNGDSTIVEVVSGGPLTQVNSDGSWIASNPVEFRVKGYNMFGWGDWGEFTITVGIGITSIPSPIYRGQAGVIIQGFGFGT